MRFVLAAGLLTLAINAAALTGPLYMLLLYDRVHPGHAFGGLVGLTLLMLLAYGLSACLDLLRQTQMLCAARRIDRLLCASAARRRSPFPARDIDQIRNFLAGYGPGALCDLPCVPLYLVLMFELHPLLGALAVAGALLVAGPLLAAERQSVAPTGRAQQAAEHRWRVVAARGPPRALLITHARVREHQEAAARPTMLAATLVRAMRPALQSATLGLGVYLSMTGACQPGSALAASVVLPRILGPLEMALAHWRSLAAARASAVRLNALLTSRPSGVSDGGESCTALEVVDTPHSVPPPQGGREKVEVSTPRVRIVVRRARDYARSATG